MLQLPFRRISACLLPFALIAFAQAQTPLVGIDQSGAPQLFTTEASDFVNQFATAGTGVGANVFAMDFEPTGTTLWAIDYDTSDYGTIDLTTGVFTSHGPTSVPPQTVIALTCQPNGSWFVFARAGADMHMYGGDVTTGGLSFFNILFGHVMADIAYASEFKLVGISATDGHLYNINPLFGDITPIMDLGAVPGFAHGVDFDWRDNTLWVSVDQGAGTGELISIRSLDNSTLSTQTTTTLGGAFSIAVQAPFVGFEAGTVFCDPMTVNSTGQATLLAGHIPATALGTLHLEATQGPPGNFGYFLVGTASSDPGTPVGNGLLCLNAAAPNEIGRYNVAGGALNSLGVFSPEGRFQNLFGNSQIPSGFDVPATLPFQNSPTISAGQTLHFQLWHRDTGTGLGSNFSNGLSVVFF